MEIRLARIISYVFHPLLMPLYGLLLILQLNTLHIFLIPEKAKWLMIGMMTIATVALPILLMLLFVHRGLIRSVKVEQREERIYPYSLMALIYFMLYHLFKSVNTPLIINNFLLGITLLIVIALIINFWWKISMHMTGIGGMAGTFTGIATRYVLNLQTLIVVTIFIAGMVGFARLRMNSHRPSEVYAGFLMGAFIMLFLYLLL